MIYNANIQLCVLCILLLCGCVTNQINHGKVANQNDKSRNYSVWPHNCDYLVFSLGRDKVASDWVLIFESALSEALEGEKAEIEKYNIYLNSAEHMMRQAKSGSLAALGQFDFYSGGSTSGENITLKPKCSRDKMMTGWFDPAELTNNISPLIIDLQVEYDGKERRVTLIGFRPLSNSNLTPNFIF